MASSRSVAICQFYHGHRSRNFAASRAMMCTLAPCDRSRMAETKGLGAEHESAATPQTAGAVPAHQIHELHKKNSHQLNEMG